MLLPRFEWFYAFSTLLLEFISLELLFALSYFARLLFLASSLVGLSVSFEQRSVLILLLFSFIVTLLFSLLLVSAVLGSLTFKKLVVNIL
jgi:hypothetical protein